MRVGKTDQESREAFRSRVSVPLAQHIYSPLWKTASPHRMIASTGSRDSEWSSTRQGRSGEAWWATLLAFPDFLANLPLCYEYYLIISFRSRLPRLIVSDVDKSQENFYTACESRCKIR